MNINIESITVYDNIGKIIYIGNSKTLNLSNYNRGIYFVKIKTTSNKIFTKKILKE
jgi:hypothetical protein